MHYARHQRETTGDQTRSSKTTVLCVPSPLRAGNEVTFACSTVFQNSTSARTPLLEMPMRQHTHTSKNSTTKIFTILRLLLYWERCNVSLIRDAHLKADFILILTPMITFLNLSQQVILICCFMAILSRWKPPGPRIMREFWSNSRVRMHRNEKRRGEDSSHPEGIEIFVRETAKKGYPDPQNFDNPMIALQDYDVRQSGRGLELQNRDLWLRQTDLSWHFPILLTIREMPFKNYRARSPAKLKVREDETEEAKKQKIPKKRDEEWNSTRWKYSSWTWTTSSSSSAWQEWSSDETRERTNWQSADWDSSDQVRKATVWQSHFSWQWGHLHRSLQVHPWRRKQRLFVTEFIFSSFLPLVLFAVRGVWTVIVPFHATSMTL